MAGYALATTLRDPRHYRARRIIALYHERREHEIAYLALRHTLTNGAGCARPTLSAVNPSGLEQEPWVLLAVQRAIRRRHGRQVPALAHNKKDPYPPEASTPITRITAIITGPPRKTRYANRKR